MKVKQFTTPLILAAIFFLTTVSAGYSSDDDREDRRRGKQFKVTITNLTRGQIISPPIVFTHKKGFKFFEAGTPASDGLALLAEDGMPGDLAAELLESSAVYRTATADGNVPPGASITVDIETRRPYRFLSAAGMLVVSNDAFFGARHLRLPWGSSKAVYYAVAYDAGSEANSESCDYIPGPPCGNGGVRDTGGAEGFIHVHAGIHGIGDLFPEDVDWRNPTVKITIEETR